MPLGPTLVGLCPAALQFCPSQSIACSPRLRKGASPVVSFSVHEAPDGPCPEPLPRQGVATCWTRVRVTVL